MEHVDEVPEPLSAAESMMLDAFVALLNDGPHSQERMDLTHKFLHHATEAVKAWIELQKLDEHVRPES